MVWRSVQHIRVDGPGPHQAILLEPIGRRYSCGCVSRQCHCQNCDDVVPGIVHAWRLLRHGAAVRQSALAGPMHAARSQTPSGEGLAVEPALRVVGAFRAQNQQADRATRHLPEFSTDLAVQTAPRAICGWSVQGVDEQEEW